MVGEGYQVRAGGEGTREGQVEGLPGKGRWRGCEMTSSCLSRRKPGPVLPGQEGGRRGGRVVLLGQEGGRGGGGRVVLPRQEGGRGGGRVVLVTEGWGGTSQ